MLKVINLVILIFISGSLLSNDSDGLSYEESKQTLEIALDRLKPESLVRASTEESGALRVKYKNEVVYLDRSLMLSALNDIYNELSKELNPEEKAVLEEAKTSVFAYLSKKTITIAKTPFLFFKDLILHLPEHMTNLSLSLPKYYQSRGPTALVVIGVTQVAWEALETVVSWAIGAGGAHAYCVVFNIALLKAVDNAKGLFQYLTARGLKLTPVQRLRLFVLTLKRDWKDGKGILKTLEKSNRTLKIDSLKEVTNQFGSNRKLPLTLRGELVELSESFRISNYQNLSVDGKLWHSYQINLGIEYLSYMLEEHIGSFTEEKLHQFKGPIKDKKEVYKTIWQLKVLEGKIIKFKEGLKLAVAASMFDVKTEAHRLSLVEFYRQYIDLIEKTSIQMKKETSNIRDGVIEVSKELDKRMEYIKKTTYSFSVSSCLKLIL